MEQQLIEFFHMYRAARSANDHEVRRVAERLYESFFSAEQSPQEQKDWIKARESEEVVNTVLRGDRAELLTGGETPGSKRYLLIRDADSWRIEKVQLQCSFCGGSGHTDPLEGLPPDCSYCAGSGWMEWAD